MMYLNFQKKEKVEGYKCPVCGEVDNNPHCCLKCGLMFFNLTDGTEATPNEEEK